MKKLYGLNLVQLINYIRDKDVYCFGCGIQGRRMSMLFENWGIQENFRGYIDNDEKKVGTQVEIERNVYNIYSFESIRETLTENTLILITCLNYQDIYAQLEKIKDVACQYIAIDEVADIQLRISDYPEIVRESSMPLIPKKIHYAWFGNSMPYEIKKNVEHWKVLCPEYEFYEWNETDYDVSKNMYMKQAYERKMWGFVPDYMRLDIIYHYGGIYLDTDIEMIKKPDDLLYQKCFGCVDASLVMNLGSGFGAIPNMDIIKKLRDYYDTVPFIKNNGIVDNTSCNTHAHLVLKNYGVKINDELQNVYGMNIYPMIFQGACQYTRRKRVTDKTYWIHYGNMSWFNEHKY